MIKPSQIHRTVRNFCWVSALVFFAFPISHAQQPFVTDDADATPKGKFHFEFSNEFDLLQRSEFPILRQNTSDFELAYGLLDNLELGVEAPLIAIINDGGTGPRTVTGIGDMNLSVKYNFLKEREGSRRPAMAIVANFELPTGSTERGLGSGLADFYANGVLQKTLTKRTTFRLNGGILFSGNQTTGELGIKARGTVFTGGGSFVRKFSPKLQLGVELTGAVTKSFDLGKGQLQTMIGGNYQVRDNVSFDFGVIGGKFVASPRAGVLLGISIDF